MFSSSSTPYPEYHRVPCTAILAAQKYGFRTLYSLDLQMHGNIVLMLRPQGDVFLIYAPYRSEFNTPGFTAEQIP
jgi:hypothetical protein